MKEDSPQWQQMGPAAADHEQHALNLLRDLLPDSPLTWVWANLSFIAPDGSINEVDAIVLNRNGLFLMEFKGWRGTFSGNQQEWRITNDNGFINTRKNPLHLNNLKAKRLADLLGKVGQAQPPLIKTVTVMHGNPSKFNLDELARAHTYALDGAQVQGLPKLSALINEPAQLFDKPAAAKVVNLLQKAGFVATPKQRMAGQYAIDLKEPLADGDGWVDVAAEHPALPGQHRRIRLFNVPPDASPQQREQIILQAKREFAFTNGLGHPGVVTPKEYIDTESGPALIFDADTGTTPLTQWLDDNDQVASIHTRLALLRNVAEVMRYAHSRRITHRALSPGKVRVADKGHGSSAVTVRDWQGALRQSSGRTTHGWPTAMYGTALHIDVTDQEGLLYFAPECNSELADPVALDVYALGSLAYLLITNRPPAPNLPALKERRERGGLDPSADLDGVSEYLVEVVRQATDPKVLERIQTVDDFLELLDWAESEMRSEGDRGGKPEHVVDPLDAQAGDQLENWLVEERLGSGSTGLALLVSEGFNDSQSVVLKVAHDSAKDARLLEEGRTLASLAHPRIVRLLDGPITLAGRNALVLEDAGRPTLDQLLHKHGQLTLEQLEKFSADLFEVAAYLDRAGVFHRDIKPNNLGVRPDPSDRRPRLILFDFSLAHEPLESINAGTAPYLDPFLGGPVRPRYDSAAERFAIAVTLFEMAAGQLPEWGDGLSDPGVIVDEVTVHPGLFDSAVGQQLTTFFASALARDAGRRHGDLDEMAAAWAAVFRAITVAEDEAEADEADRQAAADAAVSATPIENAGLTPRAVSALRRLDAHTVGEAMAVPAMTINRMRGIGRAVRREIHTRRQEWLGRLGRGTLVDDELPLTGRGVEDLLRRLVPSANGRNAPAVALAKVLVGDTEPEGVELPIWPTWGEATTASGLAGNEAAEALRASWSRSQVVADLRIEVEQVLESLGGMATPDELARTLLNRHGSTSLGDTRTRNAMVLVRAATEVAGTGLEVEVSRGRGAGEPILLGLAGEEGDTGARLDAVRVLATVVDTVVAERPKVLGSAESQRLVADHPVARTEALPPTARLLALAVAASATAALSTRGEVYPKGMPAQESVRAVLAGGVRFVTVDGLNRRVIERFPDAAPLPARPALDAFVEEAAPSLHWRDNAYTRASEGGSMLRTATRLTSATDLTLLDRDEAAQRLASSLRARSGLVLAVPPRHLDQAPSALHARYGVREVSVTAQLIHAMRAAATDNNVDWSVVLRADAEPAGTHDRKRLEQLVRLALDRFWPALIDSAEPLLLTDLAPLARYGHIALLAPLLDLTVPRLAARWLLVPRPQADGPPMLEGQPVPLAADGWTDLPPALIMPPPAAPGVPA